MKKKTRDEVERWSMVNAGILKGLHKAMTQHTWGDGSHNPHAYDASVVAASAVLDELKAHGFMICRSGANKDPEAALPTLTDDGDFAKTRIGIFHPHECPK